MIIHKESQGHRDSLCVKYSASLNDYVQTDLPTNSNKRSDSVTHLGRHFDLS